MVFRFEAKGIEFVNLAKALDVILQRVQSNGVKSFSVKKMIVEFETKSIFNYWNFALFSLVDFGEFKISVVDGKLSYKIVSYRIWLLLGVFLILFNVIFDNFIFMFCGIVIFGLVNLLFIYLSHYLFFKKVVKELKQIG